MKKFILGIALLVSGILFAGMCLIAGEIGSGLNTDPTMAYCFLAVAAVVAIVGTIISVCEIFRDNNKK